MDVTVTIFKWGEINMRIGAGDDTYEWVDNWAKIPDTPSARTGWAHHGVVVTEADEVNSISPT